MQPSCRAAGRFGASIAAGHRPGDSKVTAHAVYSFNDSPCRAVGIRRSMAKAKTVYVCQECGGVSAKWQGQCPHCQAWNTMVETVERGSAPATPNRYAHLAEAA